jgi:hypothetical protein
MRIVCSLFLVLCLWLPVYAETLTFQAQQDAWVNDANPDGNYGSNSYLSVKDRSGLAEAYIKFNQAELAALSGKQIQSATFFMYQYQGTFSPGDSLAVHRIQQDWDESTISWNTKAAYDAQTVSALDITSDNEVWRRWDGLENVVASWLGAGSTNYGLALENHLDNKKEELYTRFYSSEASTAELRPYLKVDVVATPEPLSCMLFLTGGGIFFLKKRSLRM